MNLICFRVGSTVYGIDMGNVLKLSQFDGEHLESLPHSKKHVLGAIEYEGVPVCTYDVSVYLLSENVKSPRSVVLFLGAGEPGHLSCIAGIKMNDLVGVENDIEAKDIRSIVGDVKGGGRDYVDGMVKTPSGEIVVLDVEKLVHALQK